MGINGGEDDREHEDTIENDNSGNFVADDKNKTKDEIKEKKDEINRKLVRLGNAIDTARNCGFNMVESHREYIRAYNEAYECLKKDFVFEADNKVWDAYVIFLNNIHGSGNHRTNDAETQIQEKYGFWTRRHLSFIANIYGIFPFIYSCIILLLFIILLLKYPDTNINPNSNITLLGYIKLPSTVVGIPLWAAFFGGIGACAQNFWGLWYNVWYQGTVSDEYQYQYFIVPLMSPIFGYIAYILMDMGALALGGSVSDTSLSAGNEQIYGRILVCFLAGFATNKFLEKLDAMIEKL